jgi:hypothetical protein
LDSRYVVVSAMASISDRYKNSSLQVPIFVLSLI